MRNLFLWASYTTAHPSRVLTHLAAPPPIQPQFHVQGEHKLPEDLVFGDADNNPISFCGEECMKASKEKGAFELWMNPVCAIPWLN